jgi:hypothetical protein
MAFLRNSTINRIHLHYGIFSLAQGSGGIFLLVFLLKAGLSVPATLLALAAILVGRFVLRLAVVPFAKRFGLKASLIFGSLVLAGQYLVLAHVDGVGPPLFALCFFSGLGDAFYWSSYHAYFSALGDTGDRGHQVGAREAMVAAVGIVAPLLGAWAIVTVGPVVAFAGVALIQVLSTAPLWGAPAVAVKDEAAGAFEAARFGTLLYLLHGIYTAGYYIIWNIALFLSLGESFTAYGGAMALAALVGAGAGLVLGRSIDAGHGQRAVAVAFGVVFVVVGLRAASLGSPEIAVIANALGALVSCLFVPVLMTATYNLAKQSPCPLRFQIAAEGGWDVGCGAAALTAAALSAAGFSLAFAILLALPAAAVMSVLLRGYYARHAVTIDARAAPAEPQV